MDFLYADDDDRGVADVPFYSSDKAFDLFDKKSGDLESGRAGCFDYLYVQCTYAHSGGCGIVCAPALFMGKKMAKRKKIYIMVFCVFYVGRSDDHMV